MSLETRLRSAVRQAVELQQLLEQLVDEVPPALHERTEELEDRADVLATDIAQLLHDTETLAGE